MIEIPSRLTEPATWAGFATVLTAVATQVPPPWNQYILIAAAAAGGVAMYLREAGNKPAALAAIDAIEAVVQGAKKAEARGEIPAPATGAAEAVTPSAAT